MSTEIFEPDPTAARQLAVIPFTELGLTPAEGFVASTLLATPSKSLTHYRLLSMSPELGMYASSGFTAILDRASQKLSTQAEALGLPPDFRFYSVGALGVTVLSEEFKRNAGKEGLHELYWQRFIDETKAQITADLTCGKIDPSQWEVLSHNGDRYHIKSFGFRTEDGQADKFASFLCRADGSIHPAVLTSHKQYQALRTILNNHGYIDPLVARNSGAPTNIKHIMRTLNAAYGQQLFGNVVNITHGYAVNADASAKNKLLTHWLANNHITLKLMADSLPDKKVQFEDTVPYTEAQQKGIGIFESRYLKESDTTFAVVHADALIKYFKLNRSFEAHQGKPFLFVYRRTDYTGTVPRDEEFTTELSEAEAATLLLFKKENELDITDLSEPDRLRARERFKAFMLKLERLGFRCEGWESKRRYLRFPGRIELMIN